MTDFPFQAPPVPPKAPNFNPAPRAVERVGQVSEGTNDVLPPDHIAAKLKLSPSIYRTKISAGIMAGTLAIGVLFGAMIFGGSAPQQVAGLTGVIQNPDWGGLRRCGTVSETSPCAVYFMNHSRNDRQAEDFFGEAVRQTGRQEYLIKIENPHYAKTRIPPGHIAQIRIPPLR